MKITNIQNLPQPIVDAVKNDDYTKGDADISVTELLSPPRYVALKKQFEKDIVEDASDRIYTLLGQAVHKVLERANTKDIVEKRLAINVNGWKVSGQTDLYDPDNKSLEDYKFTTAWKAKDGQLPLEYVQQLNVNAEIFRSHGFHVEHLRSVLILRDWSKLEARRNKDYPQKQIVRLEAPLWTRKQCKTFILDRVKAHQAARLSLPICSADDRWAKPDRFAVMKKGGKRAVRVYDCPKEADTHATKQKELFVEKRPGENTRCENYCAVSQFCAQYLALKNVKEGA